MWAEIRVAIGEWLGVIYVAETIRIFGCMHQRPTDMHSICDAPLSS